MKFYFCSEAPQFEAPLAEMHDLHEMPTRIALKFKDAEYQFREQVVYTGPNLQNVFFQYYNEEENEMLVKYKVSYTRKSDVSITAEESIPAKSMIMMNMQFDETALQDFDTAFEVPAREEAFYRPVALLGTYALSPSPSARGLGSGKLCINVLSDTTINSRYVDYMLNDEALLLNVTTQNNENETFKVIIKNTFVFAEHFDFEDQTLIDINLHPNELYKIEIVIRPSGAITYSCRQL